MFRETSEDFSLISLWIPSSKNNYAGSKSKEDIRDILKQIGATNYEIPLDENMTTEVQLKNLFDRVHKIKNKILLVLQYPMRPILAVPKSCKTDAQSIIRSLSPILNISYKIILFVHDLKSLQSPLYDKEISENYIQESYKLEKMLFELSDAVIVHSFAMSNKIAQLYNIHRRKIISLFIFDYLVKHEIFNVCSSSLPETIKIAIAGHLTRRNLIRTLYDELPILENVKYLLYGFIDDDSLNKNKRSDINYQGSISPDTLPSILRSQATYGLIWGNLDIDELMYFNIIVPHKLSLYIASNLPIIAPSKTYAGKLVKKLNIGYSIEKLSEIKKILQEDLNKTTIQHNTQRINELNHEISNGKFTIRAIKKALRLL